MRPGWLRPRLTWQRTIRPNASSLGVRLRVPGPVSCSQTAAALTPRATYLMAARKRDAGRPFSRDAAVAKLIASDVAMKVTTDAVQVLGGYGYTRDYPAERYMREAKVTQIFEAPTRSSSWSSVANSSSNLRLS